MYYHLPSLYTRELTILTKMNYLHHNIEYEIDGLGGPTIYTTGAGCGSPRFSSREIPFHYGKRTYLNWFCFVCLDNAVH